MKRSIFFLFFCILTLDCFSSKIISNRQSEIGTLKPIIGKWCNTEGIGWYWFEKNGVFKSGSKIDPITVQGTWVQPIHTDSIKYEYFLNKEPFKFTSKYSFLGDTLRMFIYSVSYKGYTWLHFTKCD